MNPPNESFFTRFDAAFTAAMGREASTRAAGLLRIGLALLLFCRFGDQLQPFTGTSPGWLALGAAFYLSAAWMLVGWHARLGTLAAAAVAWVLVFGVGRSGVMFEWTHHHTTLLAYAVALCALTPCGGSFSVDRWLAVRAAAAERRPPPPERGPVWAVPLFGVLVSTVYLWGTIDKVTVAFLSGARLEQIGMSVYGSSDFVATGALHALFSAAAVGVTVLEIVLAVGLWSTRARRVLVPIGIVLHAAFYLLLPLVQTFSFTMMLLYLGFYDPDDVHDAIDALVGSRRDTPV